MRDTETSRPVVIFEMYLCHLGTGGKFTEAF
jgi:hypothetical protein